MTNSGGEETRDILRMVSEGKVSPEEGERLLVALKDEQTTQRCPYCAELIPLRATTCPECHTNISEAVPRVSGRRSYRTLGGLSKTLIIYQIAVCSVLIVQLLSFGGLRPTVIPPMLLAGLGLASAILMCKGEKLGWVLGVAWACAQIVVIIFSGVVINRQLLHLGAQVVTNGNGLGVNLVGVVLLVLFLCARKDWQD